MRHCQTGVKVNDKDGNFLRFESCGKPVMSYVQVGAIRCGYCFQHAMEAQEYVDKQGQDKITKTQRDQGVA